MAGTIITLIDCELDLGDATTSLYGIQGTNVNLSIYNTSMELGDAPTIYGIQFLNSSIMINDVDMTVGQGATVYGIYCVIGSINADQFSLDIASPDSGTVYGILAAQGTVRVNRSEINLGGATTSGALYGIQISVGSLWMNRTSLSIGSSTAGTSMGILATGAFPDNQVNLYNNLIEIGNADTIMGGQFSGISLNAVNNTLVLGDGNVAIGFIHGFSGTEDGILQYINNTLTVGDGTTDQAAFSFTGAPIAKIGLLNNNLDLAAKLTGCLVYDSTTCVSTINDVNACEWNGCYMADGNIDDDPAFASPGTGDYHLQGTSTLIDAGINPLSFIRPELSEWIWYDNEGNIRPVGDGWDIGAFEYSM
jgi:hypothetical protein